MKITAKMNMSKGEKNTSIITVFILFLFGFSVSFILGETAVRALEYYQYVKPSKAIQYNQYKKVYSDERDKDYLFGHKPNLNVRMEKGFYQFTIKTNSEGLREATEYDHIEQSIIFIGDSIVEGASVENHEVLDEVFESITGVTSLNFGLSNNNTVQEYYWLKAKYKEAYNTKLIVLGFCLNDFPQNTYLRYFDPDLGNWPLFKNLDDTRSAQTENEQEFIHTIKKIIFKSELVMFIERSIKELKRKEDKIRPPFRYDQVSDKSKFYTELYMNKIRDFADSIDSELIVIIFPQKSQFNSQYESQMKMQEALTEILDKNSIKYIDLFSLMKNASLSQPDIRWYHDDTHPYKEGHRLIGEHLAQELPGIFPKILGKK